MPNTILIFGVNGQVGYQLWDMLNQDYTMGNIVAIDRSTCDMTSPSKISQIIKQVSPSFIINATAWTDVEAAEDHPAEAMKVNCLAVKSILNAANQIGCPVIHYSTDYVFDGQKKGPYMTYDEPNPLNEYGKSKLAGESVFAQNNKIIPWFVFRTSWVYSSRGKNFVKTILRLAKEKSGKTITVIDDQRGSPTSANEIARWTTGIIKQAKEIGNTRLCMYSGIYHLTNEGSCSWFEFAKEIIAQAKQMGAEINIEGLAPISTDKYPHKAKRPQNSVLNTRLSAEIFKSIKIKTYQEALKEVLGEIYEHQKV